jgi:hypothetical protein
MFSILLVVTGDNPEDVKVSSEGLAQTAAKVGGQCVRLVSQSSDYFPLTAVDGSQFGVAQNHYGLLVRSHSKR